MWESPQGDLLIFQTSSSCWQVTRPAPLSILISVFRSSPSLGRPGLPAPPPLSVPTPPPSHPSTSPVTDRPRLQDRLKIEIFDSEKFQTFTIIFILVVKIELLYNDVEGVRDDGGHEDECEDEDDDCGQDEPDVETGCGSVLPHSLLSSV